MRDFDPVDNGTFKVNMKRLTDSIDKLTAAVEKIASTKPLKEDYNEEEIVYTWANALFPGNTNDGER